MIDGFELYNLGLATERVAGSAELVVTAVVVTAPVITAAATLVVRVSGCGAHVVRVVAERSRRWKRVVKRSSGWTRARREGGSGGVP